MGGWLVGAALAAIAAGAAVPAAADVKAGVDAWTTGDYRKAVEEWRPLAIAGDPDAQFNLGQAYKLGRGVPEDPAMAESWFRKAAVQGHTQAEDNYGLALFQNGRKTEAVPWLSRSSDRGEARAQLVLGTMLFNGDGVVRDYPRAYALMTRAQSAGLRSASETLAQMDGYITPADRQKGLELARQLQAKAAAAPASPARMTVGSTTPSPAPSPTPVTTANRLPDPRFAEPGRPAPAATPSPAPSPTPAAKPARPTRAVPPPVKPAAAPKPAATPTSAPTPAPTPKPAATPKPTPKPAAATAASGRYRVQLGAFRDAGNARALWGRIGGKVGSQPSYPVSGGVTRLQAGPFRTRAEAQRACRASGVPCVIVAP